MSVPIHIRQVARPKNTVVVDTGHDGAKRYAVRERRKSVWLKGHNPSPRNGKVIGHIINEKYVSIDQENIPSPAASANAPGLSYGFAALLRSVISDVEDDLYVAFTLQDAVKILVIAMLRICKPHIPDRRLSIEYQRSFISMFFPGVHLSGNTVSKFLNNLGMAQANRKKFFFQRISRIHADHKLIVDGTLKQNNSTENDLSASSRKSLVKGTDDISIVYGYDFELKQVVCAKVYAGNKIDAKTYSDFIRDNDLTKGILITDKGFPPNEIQDELKARPNLHYLTPIKNNDARIKNNNMLAFDTQLKGFKDNIICKKQQLKNKRFLYAFKNLSLSYNATEAYLKNTLKSGSYDGERYEKKVANFGVIVFESDLDLELKTVYEFFADRWSIENVFRQFKNENELTTTRVHSDFSVVGSEFINTVATIITCKLLNKIRETDLFDHMTYRDLREDLSQVWRSTDAPVFKQATVNDGYWLGSHLIMKDLELLVKLGIVTPEESIELEIPDKTHSIHSEFVEPKRPRGRPCKTKA